MSQWGEKTKYFKYNTGILNLQIKFLSFPLWLYSVLPFSTFSLFCCPSSVFQMNGWYLKSQGNIQDIFNLCQILFHPQNTSKEILFSPYYFWNNKTKQNNPILIYFLKLFKINFLLVIALKIKKEIYGFPSWKWYQYFLRYLSMGLQCMRSTLRNRVRRHTYRIIVYIYLPHRSGLPLLRHECRTETQNLRSSCPAVPTKVLFSLGHITVAACSHACNPFCKLSRKLFLTKSSPWGVLRINCCKHRSWNT